MSPMQSVQEHKRRRATMLLLSRKSCNGFSLGDCLTLLLSRYRISRLVPAASGTLHAHAPCAKWKEGKIPLFPLPSSPIDNRTHPPAVVLPSSTLFPLAQIQSAQCRGWFPEAEVGSPLIGSVHTQARTHASFPGKEIPRNNQFRFLVLSSRFDFLLPTLVFVKFRFFSC